MTDQNLNGHAIFDKHWYCALRADAIDISLEDIAEANIAKLKSRYPEGSSEEKSGNR